MTLRKLLSIVALTLAALGPVQAQLIPATGAQASGEYPGYPAYNAVDNNEWTIWTSGTFAPAWVDMLFTSQYQVQGVQMNAAMWPNPGYANHVVYGRTIDGGYVYMGQVGTTVFDGDWFWIPNPAPLVPYNAVTFYTPMEYTSWVGWRSLYAYGTPYVPPPPTPPSVPGPGRSGDVVGRDLNAPGLGVLGHIGVYDGSATMQVMNETTVVQAVSWTNYASVATPWPTVSTNITGHLVSSCFSSECPAWDPPYGTNSASLVSANIAIGRRARQIQQIGAEYTLTTGIRPAVPAMRYENPFANGFTNPAVRGMYRCDTFVVDAFMYSTTPNGAQTVSVPQTHLAPLLTAC